MNIIAERLIWFGVAAFCCCVNDHMACDVLKRLGFIEIDAKYYVVCTRNSNDAQFYSNYLNFFTYFHRHTWQSTRVTNYMQLNRKIDLDKQDSIYKAFCLDMALFLPPPSLSRLCKENHRS